MKKLGFISMCLGALLLSFASCSKDETPGTTAEVVEDGFYVSGDATGYAALTVAGQFKSTTVENDNNAKRDGLVEKYVALEAGKTFNITLVSGASKTVYGPGSDFKTVNQANVDNEMTGAIQIGKYAAGGTFTVPTSGLYHIAIDKLTTTITILPVTKWAIIGGATPLGWSDTDMPVKGTFSKDEMTFEVTDVVLVAGDYKFRHSGAWKQTLVADPVIKINTNYGGTLAALVPGGANIVFEKANQGKYTVKAVWNKTTGLTFSLTKTGDVQIAEYPANLYINGGDFGGANWEWTNAGIVTMNPVHSHAHAFWAVVYVSANGEFKFAPGKEWKGDFGVTGTADANGIYTKGGDNIKITTAGLYTVYVDLKANKIEVNPAKIYAIGATIGGVWDYAAAAGLFTVDNTAKTITSPALQAGALRMYASTKLGQLDTPKADWWQMEFNIFNGKIEYRGTGGDQAAVNVNANQKATLNFTAKTGSIN